MDTKLLSFQVPTGYMLPGVVERLVVEGNPRYIEADDRGYLRFKLEYSLDAQRLSRYLKHITAVSISARNCLYDMNPGACWTMYGIKARLRVTDLGFYVVNNMLWMPVRVDCEYDREGDKEYLKIEIGFAILQKEKEENDKNNQW